ncbi:MAG: EamA family transporter [Chloroflexota bacterium]
MTTTQSAGRPDRVTLVAFSLAVILAGANGLAIGFSNDELPPYWGATLRFLAAGLVCAAIVAARRLPVPRGRALAGMMLYGLLAIGLSFGLLYWALLEVPTGVGVVLLALVPLATLILAVAQRVEAFRWLAATGAVVGAAGVGLIFADQLGGSVPPLSLLAVLGAALGIAQSNVLIKRLPEVHPITTNAVAMLVGALMLAGVSLLLGERWLLPHQAVTWLAVGHLVLVGTVVVYALSLFVLTRWTASSASYLHILLPLVAVPLGALFRHEPVSPLFLVGALIVIVGVYIGVVLTAREPRVPVVRPAPAD